MNKSIRIRKSYENSNEESDELTHNLIDIVIDPETRKKQKQLKLI